MKSFLGTLLEFCLALLLYVQAVHIVAPQATAQQSAQPIKRVDPLSLSSLLIESVSKGQNLARATGFVVESKGKPYLITNWHVLSGRNPETNKPLHPSGAVPGQIRIDHHSKVLGTWVTRIEPLNNATGGRRWLEHQQGSKIDVAALPLSALDDEVQIYPLDMALADTDMRADIAMPVSIIGFPLGLTGPGFFPIWKTGNIASEPAWDYAGLPSFLIDATTRPGMSGSPVMLRLNGGFHMERVNVIVGPGAGGMSTRFLGIYSGELRIAGQLEIGSEVGIVWRPQVITEILAQAK